MPICIRVRSRTQHCRAPAQIATTSTEAPTAASSAGCRVYRLATSEQGTHAQVFGHVHSMPQPSIGPVRSGPVPRLIREPYRGMPSTFSLIFQHLRWKFISRVSPPFWIFWKQAKHCQINCRCPFWLTTFSRHNDPAHKTEQLTVHRHSQQ